MIQIQLVRFEMRREPIWLLKTIFNILLVQLCFVTSGRSAEPTNSAEVSKFSHRIKITNSKETTFLTRPLGPDGYIDYIKALNQISSQGVTTKNNAAIPLLFAFGKDILWEELDEEYLQRIGVKTFPKLEQHFIHLPFRNKQKDLRDKLSKAIRTTWSRNQYPRLAKWLIENDEPLRFITKASQQSKFYSPLLTTAIETEISKVDVGLVAVMEPFVVLQRDAIHALLARAMLRLSENKSNDCWNDLLSAHRLARLIGQHPTLIGAMWSLGSETDVCEAERRFFLEGKLTPKQLHKIQMDLASLPPLLDLSDKFNRAKRWQYLDAVRHIAQRGLPMLKIINDLTSNFHIRDQESKIHLVSYAEKPKLYVNEFLGHLVDWNYVLRAGNRWYDKIVHVIRLPAGPERTKALELLNDEYLKIRVDTIPNREAAQLAWWLDYSGMFIAGIIKSPLLLQIYSGRPHSRWYMTIQMNRMCIGLLLPAFEQATQVVDRTITHLRLNQITLELLKYHHQHGQYPAKLSLLPDISLEKEIKDLYSGKPYEYTGKGQKFTIISVGMNGERDMKENSDDIVVRSLNKK